MTDPSQGTPDTPPEDAAPSQPVQEPSSPGAAEPGSGDASDVIETDDDSGTLTLVQDTPNGVVYEASNVATTDNQPAPTQADEETVELAVRSASVTSIVVRVEGKAYTITKGGTDVPVTIADEIIETAAANGVAVSTKG